MAYPVTRFPDSEPSPPRSGVVSGRRLRAPVLLANADFYGTLTATRVLGRDGVPVYVASDRLLAASRWSRRAARKLPCPPLGEADRFLDWLADVGAREPGIVLYPTSDETAFLYALRGDELSRHFRMYQPDVDTILHVLDKKRLYATARDVGLATPDTWFPESDADVERIAREAPMPLLVKPRTQVLSNTHSKGAIVTERSELLARYRQFVRGTRYGRVLLERMPDAGKAMIQRYVPDAAKRIYVLAAFLDKTGSLFAARAGMKIFQRPRTLGIGICFEHAELDPAVVEGARRLARATGYYGVFQLEFITTAEGKFLIDYNPRFYNQLAFDVGRGLALPRIVHAAACGADDEVARLVARSAEVSSKSDLVFCNAFGLSFMLAAQRLAGAMSRGEARRWRQWRAGHKGELIDPAIEPHDPFPAVVDAAAQVYGCLRHPRAFVRSLLLDGRML